MKQDIVEKKAAYPTELTEMQRRFCEYLIMNEGRTTRKEAAIKAGYAEKSAAQEAAGLIQNPKIQKYLQARSNEVNRSFTVTKNNYVRRQQVLSQTLVDQGKIEKALGFENLIGKATGQFMDIHIHGNLNDLTKAEKLDLVEIQLLETRMIGDRDTHILNLKGIKRGGTWQMPKIIGKL